MDGSFWVQGTGGSGEGFADVWINEKNFEAELVQPRRRITAQDMCDGVGKKKTCILADLLFWVFWRFYGHHQQTPDGSEMNPRLISDQNKVYRWPESELAY
jgi:hypothetical protein